MLPKLVIHRGGPFLLDNAYSNLHSAVAPRQELRKDAELLLSITEGHDVIFGDFGANASGVPFDDASGERLRGWMGIGRDVFYDATQIAILPMGFCYPGTGKSGDLPPRKECAPQWRNRLLDALPNIELILVIGQYAIDWHLPQCAGSTLTETVRAWRTLDAHLLPLPHPSPRNNIWLKTNPWFVDELVPHLQSRVVALLS